jgi:hypothetical protein
MIVFMAFKRKKGEHREQREHKHREQREHKHREEEGRTRGESH